jgi:hypothetical protein
MRRTALIAALALFAVAVPAFAASTTVDVPAKFKTLIPKVEKKSGISVRLPSTIKSYVKRTYADSFATGKTYTLDLGAAKSCHGANACFIAEFNGTRGGKPAFKRTVSLAGGVTGYFKPVTCGASCSPSFIQWKEGRVLYEIEYKGAPEKKQKSTMVALANSAIRGGDR